MTLRINCWSGPRNISTALMYSFRERSDTTVVDEPFYAHYLRTSERKHPGYEEILSSQEQYSEEVIQNVIHGNYSTPIVFFKQMCHHLVEMDLSFIDNCLNVLLIREPSLVIRSHAKNVPDLQVSDIGLDVQNHLLNRILESGMSPVVIDSAILLERPESVLKELCQILEINKFNCEELLNKFFINLGINLNLVSLGIDLEKESELIKSSINEERLKNNPFNINLNTILN